MATVDLLEKTSAIMLTEHGITRVKGNSINVFFGGEDPIELRTAINIEMEKMLEHYSERNFKEGAKPYLSESQLYEMVLKVTLHFLYMYSNWRRTNEKYKNLKLELKPSDFDSVQAHRECYWYCESEQKNNFRIAAAALMGKSMQELKSFEIAEEYFANR